MKIVFNTSQPSAPCSVFYINAFKNLENITFFDHDFGSYDVALFMTYDHSLYNESGCFRSKGCYTSTCKISSNLLNDSTYYVMASIQEKKVNHLREWDVISFIVKDDWDINGARGLCRPNDKWPPAVIRPKIEWETIRT